jgi:cbb3-type cytochrome oxidase subunit 3
MDIDINSLRIAITLASLAAFLGIVLWAYWPARKGALVDEGRRILEDAS